MKKILFLLITIILASCATTINDVKSYAKVEEVYGSFSSRYKYKVIAWRYKPTIKKYVIKTDSLYQKGSIIEIKNK
jgi:hypothetical protein